jgi:hypothetical protein
MNLINQMTVWHIEETLNSMPYQQGMCKLPQCKYQRHKRHQHTLIQLRQHSDTLWCSQGKCTMLYKSRLRFCDPNMLSHSRSIDAHITPPSDLLIQVVHTQYLVVAHSQVAVAATDADKIGHETKFNVSHWCDELHTALLFTPHEGTPFTRQRVPFHQCVVEQLLNRYDQ